ncbi:MAG: hypothetical protein M4579_007702, partial [Chaenotheca gracillima]
VVNDVPTDSPSSNLPKVPPSDPTLKRKGSAPLPEEGWAKAQTYWSGLSEQRKLELERAASPSPEATQAPALLESQVEPSVEGPEEATTTQPASIPKPKKKKKKAKPRPADVVVPAAFTRPDSESQLPQASDVSGRDSKQKIIPAPERGLKTTMRAGAPISDGRD